MLPETIKLAGAVFLIVAALFLLLVIVHQVLKLKNGRKKQRKEFYSVVRQHQEDYRQRRAKK